MCLKELRDCVQAYASMPEVSSCKEEQEAFDPV
jgi:hypothetical protein